MVSLRGALVGGKHSRAAFTLVELLVVIAIILLLAAYSVTNTPGSLEVTGVTVLFTLNAKGQAVNAFSSTKALHVSAQITVWFGLGA